MNLLILFVFIYRESFDTIHQLYINFFLSPFRLVSIFSFILHFFFCSSQRRKQCLLLQNGRAHLLEGWCLHAIFLSFSHLEIWLRANHISTPSFLFRHCHVTYVFTRPQEDLLQINLPVLIGLVKTSTGFSLVWIFYKSTLPSSTTSRTKWY